MATFGLDAAKQPPKMADGGTRRTKALGSVANVKDLQIDDGAPAQVQVVTLTFKNKGAAKGCIEDLVEAGCLFRVHDQTATTAGGTRTYDTKQPELAAVKEGEYFCIHELYLIVNSSTAKDRIQKAKDATYRLMCPAPKRPQPRELPQEVRCETFVMGAGTSGPKGAWAGFVHESQVPGMLKFLLEAKAAPPTTQQAAAAAGSAAASEFWRDPSNLDKIVAAVHEANPGHKGFWTRLLQDAFPASSGVSGARVIADARERVNTAVATLSGTTAHTAEEIATEMRLTTVQLDETAPAGHRLVAKMDKAALVKCVQHALQYSQVSVFSRVGFDEKQLLFLWTTGYTTGETFPASEQIDAALAADASLARMDQEQARKSVWSTTKYIAEGLENEFVSEPKTHGDGLSVRAQLWKRVRQMHMKDKMQEASEMEKTILNNLRMLAEEDVSAPIRSGVLVSELIKTIILAASVEAHRRVLWHSGLAQARRQIQDSLRLMLNDAVLNEMIAKLPQSTNNKETAAKFVVDQTIPGIAELLLTWCENELELFEQGAFDAVLAPAKRKGLVHFLSCPGLCLLVSVKHRTHLLDWGHPRPDEQ